MTLGITGGSCLFGSFRPGLGVALAAALAAIVSGTWLAAQEAAAPLAPGGFAYKVKPIAPAFTGPMSKQALSEGTKHTREVLQGKTALGGAAAVKFNGWFESYLFPLMTQPEQIPYLYELRRDYFLYYRYIKDNPPVQDAFTKLTLKNMREIVGDNYHPAARHNAMLIIGELNDREVPAAGPRLPPDPMRDALQVMMDELVRPTNPDAVRVACLVGILRHAELDGKRPEDRRIPVVTKNALIKTMLAIVAQQISPTSPGYEGRMWMKRQAMDVLGAFGTVGEGNAVYTALEALVGDEQAHTSLRLSAAVALGRLSYPPALKIDPTLLAAKISSVAVAAVQEELVRIKDRQARIDAARDTNFQPVNGGGIEGARPFVPRDPRGIPIPGVPGAEGPGVERELTDAERRTEFAKRRLRQELYFVQQGLVGRAGDGGVLALARTSPEATAVIAGFQKAVADMQAECESPQHDLDLFGVAIGNRKNALATKLQPVLRPAGAAPVEKKPTVEDVLP